MPESATAYLPFPFPGPDLLAYVQPDGAQLEQRGEGEFALRWSEGAMRIQIVPRSGLADAVRGLGAYLMEHGGAPIARVRALHSQAVLELHVTPGVQEPTAWRFLLDLVGATDGLLRLPDGNVYTRTGASLLAGLPRPDATTVARRALVLLACSERGLLDQDAGSPGEAEAEALRAETWAWMVEVGLDQAAEPAEVELLQTPIGKAHPQAIINGVWRAEGAQVLLWALGQRPLPRYDAQEHPYAVARDAGLRADDPAALRTPTLRSPEVLESKRLELTGLSWRFVQARVDGGQPVDFAAVAARAALGPYPTDDLDLLGGDLALRGTPISKADPELVGLCASIARERHVAANWLAGANPVYSRVDTPT